MRRTRLTTTLVAIPLAAAACGTATTSTAAGGHGGPGGPVTSGLASAVTPRSFASAMLARFPVPFGAKVSAHAPSWALEHPPELPGLIKRPVVLRKFWTSDSSATAVLAWLKSNLPDSLDSTGTGFSWGPGVVPSHYLAYRSAALPDSLAIGELYLAVVPTGPSSSAIGAYALTLAQPPRPAAEMIPLDVSSAVIQWSLAPGGTPAQKELTGPAAVRLARDFNSLRVNTWGTVHCPMMTVGSDIVVTFTADGQTWKVDVPLCPDVRVTRDGSQLPALASGKAFLDDLKKYTGQLPESNPPRVGGVIPLVKPPPTH